MPRIEFHDNALLSPVTRLDAIHGRTVKAFDGGVCTAEGVPVPLGQHPGGLNTTLPVTDRPPPEDRLEGTWFYGGWFRRHFGHFINESICRFWAFPEHGAGCDGVVFLNYGPPRGVRGADDSSRFGVLRGFLSTAGIHKRCLVVTSPHAVDRLIVPEQAGIGPPNEGIAGVAAHKAFMASIVPDALPPPDLPTERIYVSRAGLSAAKGKFVLETAIEENLRQAGWGILRPERHPLAEQIAAYRAARVLLFAEGSALHLAAPYIGPEKRVGLLWRTGLRNSAMYRQVIAAGVRDIFEFTDLAGFLRARDVAPPGRRKGPIVKGRTASAVPDFALLGAALATAGLIPQGMWRSPAAAEIEAGIAEALTEREAAQPQFTHEFAAVASLLQERD